MTAALHHNQPLPTTGIPGNFDWAQDLNLSQPGNPKGTGVGVGLAVYDDSANPIVGTVSNGIVNFNLANGSEGNIDIAAFIYGKINSPNSPPPIDSAAQVLLKVDTDPTNAVNYETFKLDLVNVGGSHGQPGHNEYVWVANNGDTISTEGTNLSSALASTSLAEILGGSFDNTDSHYDVDLQVFANGASLVGQPLVDVHGHLDFA